ncbi:MAG TPA: DEAD/DEAH box helicase [Motilibacterales bacterium]|nr:DEAD/DEAH box helicase [Motilibacterales bacterium]
MDLLLDRDGLWTTAPGDGPATMRSLPVPGGMAPGRVWATPIDARLGPVVADLLDPGSVGSPGPPSLRAVALARLTAAAVRAADESPVPVPSGAGWRWRAAPGPALAGDVDAALAACLAAGVVVDDEPEARLRAFVDDVVDTRVAAGLVDPDLPIRPSAATSGQRGATLWADHVIARAAANARIALVLSPPDAEALPSSGAPPGWSLAPLAIRIDEPTTRLPWGSADPALFGAPPGAWARWVETEASMLSRAWGTRLAEIRDETSGGSVAGVAGVDVLEFVDQVAPRLQAAGFDVVAPGGLLRSSPVRRRLTSGGSGTGALSVDGLGLHAQVLVDGESLTAEDLAALAASKSELVSVRGRWLRIGPQDAQRLAALARRLHRPVTPGDLLADEAFEGIELDADQILPAGLRPARSMSVPGGVRATLRPYQRAGLDWLAWLADNQVGGILADDMGLGKTLQVLTWIESDHERPTLVVCPVTLVDTWARQAAEFTPSLRVRTFHGVARGSLAALAADADVVVTTYGLLARDESLAQVAWHRVVLDEAQAIKNPDTRAARAARTLTATHRLVVTGTPVENHLGDLWSLMAFAHPGLLPRRKLFTKRYTSGDPVEVARLRAVVGPFLLRRAKTDPGILPDLPDRQVIRADCTLTREQLGAYEAVVADMMGALEELRQAAASGAPGGTVETASGRAPAASDPALMGRRAAVLGGISRLKQICVHPALLTESRHSLGDRSGKVTRLVDLCAQIVDEGQAVVVFTQFASFVPDLAAHLRHTLGVEVATLTGSDSRAARSATVTAFSAPNGPPILIASLKAGGTGLTLVRANHVIHLDRWWNPAVEDQASDRVWRIGQHQKVTVHVLVCPGTLEDRIDEALTAKRSLAAAVVRSTESAITEMSDADLSALVGLVRERVLE